ncbi:hypothetical protein N0V93_007807 [Gnomoniopsis smithogilvyi]|uniref:Nucleotidyltransferase n=1 Tax=Gnomoniopsis smithogilvyi TaxID=1191159 RepID=A0A9W8YN00_9PEZI|nr:hypothetical protein N0V93_007807 [Gnomoniopsis smithogilvyi]
MPFYTLSEQDDLEEQSGVTPTTFQTSALILVSSLLEQHRITYGLIGGMNFCLRGSGRTTSDIDIAVDNRPRMETLLDIFNNDRNIWRPGNKLQWASGVARLFVRVQGNMVQIDLMPKGAEGFLIPNDLRAAVETLNVTTLTQCKFLRIGPLVAAKIKAHYGRETDDDYDDLRFVCKSQSYAPMVRQAANTFRREWKESFLGRVIEEEPELETQVRWALHMERSPPPGDKSSPSRSGGKGSGGSSGRSGGGGSSSRSGGGGSSSRSGGGGSSSRGGGGGSSSRSPPRDGDKSHDGYWTFSGKHNKWYHSSSNGSIQWAR